MLCLSRKLNESITITTTQGDIVVTVIEIDRGKIKLGFEAAREVLVMRTELLPKAKPGEAA